jgi:hypothetical protein
MCSISTAHDRGISGKLTSGFQKRHEQGKWKWKQEKKKSMSTRMKIESAKKPFTAPSYCI